VLRIDETELALDHEIAKEILVRVNKEPVSVATGVDGDT